MDNISEKLCVRSTSIIRSVITRLNFDNTIVIERPLHVLVRDVANCTITK